MMLLSNVQYIEVCVVVLMFLILIGFLRTIILNQSLDSKNIMILTFLFAIWYILVNVFTNIYFYNSGRYSI